VDYLLSILLQLFFVLGLSCEVLLARFMSFQPFSFFRLGTITCDDWYLGLPALALTIFFTVHLAYLLELD